MVTRKALVTGSAKGIGRAIALDLAKRGFDIAFHYNRSAEPAVQAQEEAKALGVNAIALQADITDPEQAKSLVDQAAQGLEGLSTVVNVVGNFLFKPTSEVSVDEWHEIMNSNLNYTFYITQAALPHLKAAGWGRIVNFACASAQHVTGRRKDTPYVIAKTGIIIYTKSIAIEMVNENITANVIAPGVVENSIGLDEVTPPLLRERPATFQEINDAVWFFVNPDSGYITGQVVEVSGGWKL